MKKFSGKMGFMQPTVVKGTWWTFDGPRGSETVSDDDISADEIADWQRQIEENGFAEVNSDFVENRKVHSIDSDEGWVAYLSAPGYLDRTDNMGPFRDEADAWMALVDEYPEEFGPDDIAELKEIFPKEFSGLNPEDFEEEY